MKRAEIAYALIKENEKQTVFGKGQAAMNGLDDTKTQANLAYAFQEESKARNRYVYYASQAKKDGYEQIASLFFQTADREQEHAKIWFKLLNGQMQQTAENLAQAAAQAHAAWSEMYTTFAGQAREEGFDQIAGLFEGVAAVEKRQEARFCNLIHEIEQQTLFENQENALWRCRNCGYECRQTQAPVQCPLCTHPQAYFEKANTDSKA